jgi:hypothetical protein
VGIVPVFDQAVGADQDLKKKGAILDIGYNCSPFFNIFQSSAEAKISFFSFLRQVT